MAFFLVLSLEKFLHFHFSSQGLFSINKFFCCDMHEYVMMLREVATLSRLQHQHVVRYYQVRVIYIILEIIHLFASFFLAFINLFQWCFC